MPSEYFFKIGSRHIVVRHLKEHFDSLTYLKNKNNRTNVFDAALQAAIAEFQKYHNLKVQDGFPNEETYAQMGKAMLDYQIDIMSLNHPQLEKMLYGVGLIDVCADWEAAAPVIPKDKFIGWGHKDVKKVNCFHYAWHQLKVVGKDLKSPGWGTSKQVNPNVYQLYLTQDVAGMKKGYQAQNFTQGVLYLKKAIKSRTPVMVGVEDATGSPNTDKVTDHFVTIVGMGTDTTGNYFSFYDNATGDTEMGTSDQNRIYCDCKKYELKGGGPNSYIQKTEFKSYIVTQIRESK